MTGIAVSSQACAVLHCSHVCCCRHAYIAASIFRQAELDDSISAPTSGNIRFAESADRQPRCKFVFLEVVDLTKTRGRRRCRLDALSNADRPGP